MDGIRRSIIGNYTRELNTSLASVDSASDEKPAVLGIRFQTNQGEIAVQKVGDQYQVTPAGDQPAVTFSKDELNAEYPEVLKVQRAAAEGGDPVKESAGTFSDLVDNLLLAREETITTQTTALTSRLAAAAEAAEGAEAPTQDKVRNAVERAADQLLLDASMAVEVN